MVDLKTCNHDDLKKYKTMFDLKTCNSDYFKNMQLWWI